MEQLGKMVFKHETSAISRPTEGRLNPHEAAIKTQILLLATARQADAPELTLRAYSKGLSGFAIEDVKAAVAMLAVQERLEGHTALPSMGEMTTVCRQAAQRRHEAARRLREEQHVQYVTEHPEEFCECRGKDQLIQMIRQERARQIAAVEAHFGPEWRDNLVWNGFDAQGRELSGSVQLGDLFRNAV